MQGIGLGKKLWGLRKNDIALAKDPNSKIIDGDMVKENWKFIYFCKNTGI